jgi:predicted nucleic acid-binding protein
MRAIIADSSTLIVLLDTNNFSLLFALFDEVLISNEVHKEISHKFDYKQTIDHYRLSKKLQVLDVEHGDLYEILLKRLDKGESESIVLAKSFSLPLIIDEKKGRSIAKTLDIVIIGFVGILLKLLDKKVIQKEQALSIVKHAEKNDFRLSDSLKKMVFEY